MKKLLAIIPLAAAAAACNSSGCLDNGSALPLARFYSSATGDGITVDSIQINGIGAPGDSVLLSPSLRKSQVYLPMRADAPSTSWVIAYRQKALDFPELNDTVTFAYETIPYFASEECGAMYIYRITSVTHTFHLIDSIKLTDPLITNVDIERIQIFFRTAQEEPAR